MPIYTYRCACSHQFEIAQPYFAKKPKCPMCNKKTVEKVITPPIVTRVDNITTVGQQGERNYKRDRNKIKEISQMKKENDAKNKNKN